MAAKSPGNRPGHHNTVSASDDTCQLLRSRNLGTELDKMSGENLADVAERAGDGSGRRIGQRLASPKPIAWLPRFAWLKLLPGGRLRESWRCVARALLPLASSFERR
jgi:hypothetical protein